MELSTWSYAMSSELTDAEKAYILARFQAAKTSKFADLTAKYRDGVLVGCDILHMEDRVNLAALYLKKERLKEGA